MAAIAVMTLVMPNLRVSHVARGDSAFGEVTAVRRADIVLFNTPGAEYTLRIVGIVVPRDQRVATSATDMVRQMVLGKKARFRLERRLPTGELLVRLLSADPSVGFRDVGLELVRAGLAQKQANFDYKYQELSRAETEARRSRRGLWANQR
jgi:endonuclease YncB( thermonuclease family)